MARGRAVAQGSVPELLAQTGETRFEEAFVKLAFADSTTDDTTEEALA